jgi:nucleotidyltransferase substrate binding protein (TIGR01987 family)
MGGRRVGNDREHGSRDRIDTGFLRRCIRTLEVASREVKSYGESDILRDLYRAACVKEFELVLEQSGMLLRKRLAAFFASNRQADELAFKDLFRYAAKHRLIDVEMAERWLGYRDRRNDTTHRYGEHFAEAILDLLPAFIADAKALADTIEAANDG